MNEESSNLDKIDARILRVLQADGRGLTAQRHPAKQDVDKSGHA